MAVQARTLELYRQLGLADEIVAGGLEPGHQPVGQGRTARAPVVPRRRPRADAVSVRADLPAGPPRARARAPPGRSGRAGRAQYGAARLRAGRRRCRRAAARARGPRSLRGGLAGRLRRRVLARPAPARHRLSGGTYEHTSMWPTSTRPGRRERRDPRRWKTAISRALPPTRGRARLIGGARRGAGTRDPHVRRRGQRAIEHLGLTSST